MEAVPTLHSSSSPSGSVRLERPAGALILLLLWSLILGWQVMEHLEDSRRHEAALLQAGESSIHMLEAALRSMGRGRRQRPEFLQAVFEEAAKVPGVRGIWLADPAGGRIAATGEGAALAEGALVSGERWDSHRLLVGRLVDIGECLVEGRGPSIPEGRGFRRGAEELAGPLSIGISLDRAAMDRELAADLRLRIAIQTVAGLAAVGGFLILRGRERARRLRTDLAVAEERARQHREQAALGAGLAHETKNPLSVVRGLAQRLAAEEEGSPEKERRARDIVDEVDRVVSRINEFLRYARPLEPRPEDIALPSLLEEMARLIEADVALAEGSVRIAADERWVRGDRAMLRQMLLNLLVNAARVLPERGTIWLEAHAEADGSVTLEVRDNGSGIALEDKERVFEPYYSRSAGGTGLGLAIVRRLAELQGWRVELESEPGKGAAFRIRGLRLSGRAERAGDVVTEDLEP